MFDRQEIEGYIRMNRLQKADPLDVSCGMCIFYRQQLSDDLIALVTSVIASLPDPYQDDPVTTDLSDSIPDLSD